MSKARVVMTSGASFPITLYAPTSGQPIEKWWHSPVAPKTHVSLAVAELLLSQKSQNEAGGKQSCVLTSQLNALIARSTLTSAQALEVQDSLVADSRYQRWWRPLGESDFLGWSEDPADLAFFLKADFGTEIGLEHIASSPSDIVAPVTERLNAGYAVVLMGRSALGSHARLAFEPQEDPGQIYIHDPKYPETTGLYAAAELTKFQTSGTAIVF